MTNLDTQSNSSPQKKYVREIRSFDDLFQDSKAAGPTGLVYNSRVNRFLSLDAQSTTASAFDLTAITPLQILDTPRSARVQAAITNPLNTTFDSKFNRLLVLQNPNQLIAVSARADGSIDPTTLTRTNIAQQFGLQKPQGLSVDSSTGNLYILNQTSNGAEIVRVQPDSTGSFDKATVSRIALPTAVDNPRGIAFDPNSGNLQILSPSQKQLYEVSQAGTLVGLRDLSGIALRNPQALVFAPSGDQTDDPQELSLYVADSTPGGGGIRELTFVEPPTISSTLSPRLTTANSTTGSATLVRTVNTSQYSPPSPDPAGIVYISHTNSLMIVDSEVEEMSNLFAGKNVYTTNLAGSLQSTQSTLAFSREPTGIAYNPANRFIYVSDDNNRRVYQVNPGTDGLYFTSDDAVSSFSGSGFSADIEDLVFSTQFGDLFLLDGLNSQVYRVTTSGTLVSQFDTESLGVVDPEGITIGDNGNLYIVGNPGSNNNSVAEVTTSGQLVQTFSIAAANPIKPAGLAFAPSSQDSSRRSLYIVDRGIDNNDDPNENDGKLYEFMLPGTSPSTPGVLAFSAANFSVNEDGTPVVAVQVTRTGGSSGAVSATVSLSNGTATAPADYNNSSITVNFANGDSATKTVVVPIVNDTSVESNETINLSLGSPTNGSTIGSQNTATLTIIDNDTVQPTSATLFLSFNNNGTVGGVSFSDEDILSFNESTGSWSMYFDGSDVGLASFNVRDFHVNADGSILFALNNPVTLSGAGAVDDSDVVRFVPTSTGSNTSGSFELYFDGSDVGLDSDSEELDGIAIAPDGRLVISTEATPSISGLSGLSDEDLLVFNATGLGTNTVGTWTLYMDASDVGLSDSAEDIDGVWIDNTEKLYLSTQGAYNVATATGDGSDVFTFTPTSLGANTSGSFAPFFDGSNNGITTVVADGVSRLV